MEMYTVRDSDGTMIARVGGHVAQEMMKEQDGFWRMYVTNTDRRPCWEVKVPFTFTFGNHVGGMRVYFWEGTVFIKEKV